MTSTDSPQRARPNWSKRIAIAVGCMAIVGLIVGLAIFGATKVATKCEDIDEPSVRSPDGRWVAESTIRACPAGPLSVTNYDVIVALATTQTQASAKVDRVQIFENFGSS